MADTGNRGYLISIKNNGETGSRLPITVDSCYIGANAECEVRLLDADCEDRYCLIKFLHSKHAIIYCLCTERPVLLNDEPINENGSPLKNGDIIQIIDVKFRWEENDSFVGSDLGRYSLNVENISSEEVERKRFSEPAHIMNRTNLIEDEQEDEPHLNYNNINANEKKDETKVTSETTPLSKSSISSPAVKTAISSCGNNRSNYNRDSHNQSENNSSRDASQIRRSRQFCQTYKTKSIANTPDKKKTTPTVKSFFKNTPLQENNRTLGREVKSRFFVSRNSSLKPATPLSFAETSEKISVQQNGNADSNHEGNVDNLEKEVENMVPRDDADIELKENTFGNETNAEEATFETTVPSDTVDARTGLATPRCFIKAFHSTPKASDLSESELASNLEANETTNISDAIYGPDDPTKICSLDNNSIFASPVKSAPESDVFCKKNMELDNSRLEPDSLSETRRHHTRSTSNILKKTFEECSEDNLPAGEKSLTTPEKSTNECYSQSRNPALIVEESELDSYSPEKKVDSRKSVSGLVRSPMLESTSELSAENGDAVSSLSLEVRDKSQKHDDSSMMAKCSRNLSSFSPPENNRSQEYMDSVVVSTPMKPCFVDDEEVSLSMTAVTTPAKDSMVDGAACMSTPKTPGSPTRHRRSTGIVPCVGTPSDVYRTTKGGLTPAHKSRFNRTSMEVEVSIGPRDSLSYSAPSRLAPKRSSSERKSTPLKSDKSVARDSLQMHSPIAEEYDLENEESQNESLNNDSQFQFVSKRRRRLAKSSFAIEDRILEESEIISSDLSLEENEVINEEESLEPMESFDDNSEFASTRIVVNRTAGNDTENDLDSTYNLDSLEDAVDGSKLELTTPAIKPALPKSILTPLPRHAITTVREKSAKKVTFFNLKEDSLNIETSACSMTDLDSEYDLQLSSRVNSSADVSRGGENTSLPKNDSDDERLYLSDAYSFNSSVENSDSIVQQILAKRNKSVKRLSGASKSKSPRLSGVRRLMNPPRSPKCDYMNVSGVKQLMKTPESLLKPVKKPSMKTPEIMSMKTPKPSKETEITPESRTESSKAIANRQKTPASFGKRAKMPDALAECLSTPKALMELAKPPEIVVEFVGTPKKTDVSVTLPTNEVGESTPCTRRDSQACSGDSTFATPTMRRCSKHFRIHRNSLCLLASSLNSTLNETLSPHDCSASLENSITEQNAENAENEIMPPPQNPEAAFKVVLVELREKLRTLRESRDDANKEVLENSVNMIDEVLVAEPAPGSDTSVAEQKLENVLLDLKKRFSFSEKSNENHESAAKTEVCKSVIPEIDNEKQSIPSQSNGEDKIVVAAAGDAIKDSFVDKDIADASPGGAVPILLYSLTNSQELSSSVANTTDSEKVLNNISCVKNSEEIQNSVSDAVEEILRNVCGGAKTDETSKNILCVLSPKEVPSNVSVALHSNKDVSCPADLAETVNSAFNVVDSEDTQTSISNVTSFVQINNQNSLCVVSEVILSATDDFSKSVDAYHSTIEFEESALVENETTAEPQVDDAISESVEMQLSQSSSSISHMIEKEEQPQPDTSVPNMGVSQLPNYIVETEEQETDSENLELFVSDSDEVVLLKPKSTTEEKFNTISDVTEATIGAVENSAENSVENTTDLFLATTPKSSLPENCVEEIKSKKSTIPATDSPTTEIVLQKSSCLDNSAVSNDTFETCSPVSNLTLTAVEVEESEKTPKILDTIMAHEKSKRLFDVSASLLVHEENKENLLSLTLAETVCDETIASDEFEEERQNDSASISVSQEIVSAAVSKESVQENGTNEDSEVAADDNAKVTALADITEKTEMPVKRTSRNLSVVIQDAKVYLPSAKTDSTPLEAVRKNITAEKSVTRSENAYNEGESSRPKRGRPTKRYTESKGGSSTQSSKQTKNMANAASSNIMNVSVNLERLEEPREEETAKATQRKTVHFNIEPAVKRPTKPRDLGKLYVPTPKRRRTESKTEDCDADDTVDQLGSPCSIIIRKMRSDDKNASTTTKDLPKRASRSRSVAPKESVLIRPSRAASVETSSGREVTEPKRGTRVKKMEQVLSSKVSAKKESQLNGGTMKDVPPKSKDTTKTNKSVAKNGEKTIIAESSKEEKRSKRKAADEVVQNADTAGSSTSGSNDKSKNKSLKVIEVPAEGERRTTRKAAEVLATKTKKEVTKNKKNVSQSKDEEPVCNAKSQNEVPAKEEKRSRRKVAEDVQEDEKNDNTKARKRATKGAEKNEVSETMDDSKSSSRATRQRKAAQPVVEAPEPPKTAKRAKVDLSTETATTSRATRSRKDAVETIESSEKNSKLTKNKATVAPETSKSKAPKRTTSVLLDSVDEVVSKKRRQSPNPVPVATRTTRNKKNEVAVVSSVLKVNLKRQKSNDKENKPSVSTKTAAEDEKPVALVVNKKKRDPTLTENVRVTRATKVKEAPQKESSIAAVAASTTRVTRSQNVPILPVSRRAKK